MTYPQEVLEFWFGTLDPAQLSYSGRRKVWFGRDSAFDDAIRQRFLNTYQQAAVNGLDYWRDTPLGTLALILVLDQFPRNMFRNSPQAFATDEKARAIASDAVEHQLDQQLHAVQRLFMYLPLEHSEAIADQDRSVRLFEALTNQAPELIDCLDYAQRHRDVIERFGRFPHRNVILGRESTEAELEFLKQPGSSF